MVNTYQFCTQKLYHMNTRHHPCIWVIKQSQLGDPEALQPKRKKVSHSTQPMEGESMTDDTSSKLDREQNSFPGMLLLSKADLSTSAYSIVCLTCVTFCYLQLKRF